eukprot:m.72209 g.72209  ORF g.72209 m.72209 type:complete len:221 (+) comp16948_c2_seq1:265-927(+)
MDQVAQAVGAQVLTALQQEEARIDEQLKKLESMDEDDLEKLRRVRELRLRKQMMRMQDWKSKGHGEYTELGNQQEFFQATKDSERVVVHFYRGSSPHCELVDKHLAILAKQQMETKFVKINAEKSPFLCERLNIWMLPSIVLIKDNKTLHTIAGLDELGGDSFTTQILAFHLSKFKMIDYKEARPESPTGRDDKRMGLKVAPKSIRSSARAAADDSDDDD